MTGPPLTPEVLAAMRAAFDKANPEPMRGSIGTPGGQYENWVTDLTRRGPPPSVTLPDSTMSRVQRQVDALIDKGEMPMPYRDVVRSAPTSIMNHDVDSKTMGLFGQNRDALDMISPERKAFLDAVANARSPAEARGPQQALSDMDRSLDLARATAPSISELRKRFGLKP